jgi:hypothetical protein
MANHLFAYSGGKGVATDEAERNAQYAQWAQWFGELGSAVVEGGAAMGTAKTIGPGGSVSDGGSRSLTGYSIVSADSLDSAVELAQGSPVLEIGGAVAVYEAIAMQQAPEAPGRGGRQVPNPTRRSWRSTGTYTTCRPRMEPSGPGRR